jgi:hypothetical protein
MNIKKIKTLLLILLILMISNAHSVVDTDMQEVSILNVNVAVVPYTTVSVSTNELSFSVLGTPGAYISTDVVTLTVDSNQSTWSVYAQASNLAHKDFGVADLPAERLSFAINDSKRYLPLKNNVLFLQGVVDQVSEPVKLSFRLTTTWQDTPGIYKGKVTIAFLNNP